METRGVISFIAKQSKEPLTIAEVGVSAGEHALSMLKMLPIKELYLIDNYAPYQDGNIFRSQLEQGKHYAGMFKKVKEFYDKVILVTKDSDFASTLFADNYFDLIYIDACHDYAEIKKDISNWWPKVKPGAYLGGHDYCESWPGVIKAVGELTDTNQATLQTFNDIDWLVKK
ncbi:MAG: class I SAM-dependent methyltransferase [bacterium]|nr:class I SAM-dependent methyltransferase [bacterium]